MVLIDDDLIVIEFYVQRTFNLESNILISPLSDSTWSRRISFHHDGCNAFSIYNVVSPTLQAEPRGHGYQNFHRGLNPHYNQRQNLLGFLCPEEKTFQAVVTGRQRMTTSRISGDYYFLFAIYLPH